MKNKLWGNQPYSESNLIYQNRLIGDSTSRNFIIVQLTINPYTFETVKQNKKKFLNNPAILTIITEGKEIAKDQGYSVTTFCEELIGKETIEKANTALQISNKALTTMHRFVMRELN